jgi:CBS-domain-containing membrane protein
MQPQPAHAPVATAHGAARLAWCLLGAAIGLALAFWVLPQASEWTLASLGGSALFLFGETTSAAAQPRALFGGHLGGALIGICCYRWFGDATWVYVAAEVVTFAYMLATRTAHPPAAANPWIMIHGAAGFSALLQPVLLGVGILALVAFAWSRAVPGAPRYPVQWRTGAPREPLEGWRG